MNFYKIINLLFDLYYYSDFIPSCVKKLRVDKMMKEIITTISNFIFPLYYKFTPTNLNPSYADKKIIVSLTSFPQRIDKVWITIESIMHQTIKPDKIILWLSKEEFKNPDRIPSTLKKLTKRGLEIEWVEGNLKSHKKYYYAFDKYKEHYLLLIDDDIIYPRNMISLLKKDMSPEKVHCSFGYIISYNEKGEPRNYKEWSFLLNTYYGKELFFGSGGGTLLNPSSFPTETLIKDIFMEITPLSDDIWLNAMARINNLTIKKVREWKYLPVRIKNNKSLYTQNLLSSYNDVMIKKIRKRYPFVFSQDRNGE